MEHRKRDLESREERERKRESARTTFHVRSIEISFVCRVNSRVKKYSREANKNRLDERCFAPRLVKSIRAHARSTQWPL